jgi:hypothetical protein
MTICIQKANETIGRLARTAGFRGRDGERSLLANAHSLKTFILSLDDLADSDYNGCQYFVPEKIVRTYGSKEEVARDRG